MFAKTKLILKSNLVNLGVILVFLCLIITLSHELLPNTGVISYGDASYLWKVYEKPLDIISTFSPNYLGQDQSNIVFAYVGEGVIISLLKHICISDQYISYMLSFGILFLCSITYYFLFKKISGNVWFGIFSGFLIMLNNLTLDYILMGQIFCLIMGQIGFAIVLYKLYDVYKNKKIKKIDIISLTLISILFLHPFLFIMNLILLGAFFIFMYFQKINKREFYKRASIILIFIILVASYWLIPFVYGSLIRTPSETYGQANLENVWQGFKLISNFINRINFFSYPLLFPKIFNGDLVHHIFYITLFSLPFILGLFKEINKNPFYLFLIILFLLFFILSLGPTAPILGLLWEYLWEHLSWFSFFRSFSRFLIIVLPIWLFCLGFSIKDNSKKRGYIFIILIILLIFLNATFFSGDFKGSIRTVNPPQEYQQLNDLIKQDYAENNIISFPIVSYEMHTWSINKNYKSVPQSEYMTDYLFVKPMIMGRTSLMIHEKNKFFKGIFNIFLSNNETKSYEDLLKINVKYILIQKDLTNHRTNETVPYEQYNNYFMNKENYNLLLNNSHFYFYRLQKNSSIIDSKNIFFIKINPSKYRIYLFNITPPLEIKLLQNYHTNWKIFLKAQPSKNWCQPIIFNELKDSTECFPNEKFFEGEELSYLYKKPIFDETHQIVYDYANQWTIDPQYIKDNYPPKYYTTNDDGSINVELVMYFRPQSYFYLGLIISSTTLICCIGYLIYDWRRGRKQIKKYPKLKQQKA